MTETKKDLLETPAKRKNLLDARAKRELGAAVRLIEEKGEKVTPERRDELVEEVEKNHALRTLDAPRPMLNHRIRQLKRNGYSNVAIGKVLGISESTVRRRLNMPLQPIEILLDKTLADLEDARVAILESFMDHPESKIALDYGDKHGIRIHTNARKVSIDPKLKRVKFTLDFTAIVKDMQ